jgi:hypothetical protein
MSLIAIQDGNYIVNLHAGQSEAWNSKKRWIAVLAGTQGGKALAVDTPIPVSGGFKPMGEIVVGDTVFNANGDPCVVTGVSPVYFGRGCFRVVFDDGSAVVADAEHLWQTQTHAQRKNLARRVVSPLASWASRPQCKPRPSFSVVTTNKIRETISDGRGHNNHSIPLCGGIENPAADLPISPYVLGAWLGDGDSSGSRLYCADPEILEEIAAEGVPVGTGRECNGGKALCYTLGTGRGRGGNDRVNPLLDSLRRLNLIGDKHIPDCYLFASFTQRLALLQGLMDTDGTVGHYCEFSNSNKRLARQVLILIKSLGIKARIKSRIPKCNGKPASRSWRVTFSTRLPVFRLQRKLARISESIRADALNRYVVAVEPCPSVPVKCIAVDSPDRLYLCSESFIPTHNTSFGPLWLWREIQARGPGDYLAVTATFDLFKLKMLPALRELFIDVLGIARYWVSDRILEIKDPKTGTFWATTKDDPMYCRIILRSADAYGGLEAATAKAAWIDEAGLIPDALPWEATQRRLAINLGRALITTTLYDFAWLKRVIYDPWERSHHKHPDIDVISFDSIANPSFPKEEWERAMREMEAWKFDMMYRGRYSRPFGMIYQAFNAKRHVMSRMGFDVPRTWPRFLGLDFGGANLAGVFLAQDPLSRRVYAYRTYLDGHRGVREHVEALLNGEPFPIAVGGAGSEDQWRRDFAVAGLPVQAPPIRDVEVGITRVHSFFKQDKIIVFDHLHPYIDQIGSYSRVVDKATGEVTEKIRNKEMYHYLDATRYILSYLYVAGFLTPESIGSGGAFVAQSYINEACQ